MKNWILIFINFFIDNNQFILTLNIDYDKELKNEKAFAK